jgi:hypothetical protein
MSLEVHRSRCHHDREWEWSMAANSLIIIEGRKRFASSAFSFVVIARQTFQNMTSLKFHLID